MRKLFIVTIFANVVAAFLLLHTTTAFADNTYPPGFGSSAADDKAEQRLNDYCPTSLKSGNHTLGILYADPAVTSSGGAVNFSLKSGARVCDGVDRYKVRITLTSVRALSQADSATCNTAATLGGITLPYNFDPQGQTIRGTLGRYFSDTRSNDNVSVTGLKEGCNGFEYKYCMYARISPTGKDNFSCEGRDRFYIDYNPTKTPLVDCEVTNQTLLIGQSIAPVVVLRHRGPSGAPSSNVTGTIRVKIGTTNVSEDSVSESISNGSTITKNGSSHLYTDAGTYTVSGDFTVTATNYSATISCSGTITASLPKPVVGCSASDATILTGASYAVNAEVLHKGPAYAPSVDYGANISVVSQAAESFSGTLNNGQKNTLPTASRVYSTTGQFVVNVGISGSGFDSVSCTATITVLTGPYMRTYGADVQTGGGFLDSAGLCTNNDGDIRAFIKGSSDDFAGSGSQLAVFARGAVRGFRSASMQDGAFPFALNFANTTANAASGVFGGQSGQSQCMQNYWITRPTASEITDQIVDIGALSDVVRAYYVKQSNSAVPVVLTGRVANGHSVAIYVEGDVFIKPDASGRFGYDTSGWGSANMIPSLYVVAHGNINISSNAKSLEGSYIAVPTSDSSGRINTCTNPITMQLFTVSADIVSQCNKQLVIRGTFSAKHINFMRTYGTLKDAVSKEPIESSKAAELFVYNIENMLATQPTRGISRYTYDSITALPPSL